jgi:hypothetical protein
LHDLTSLFVCLIETQEFTIPSLREVIQQTNESREATGKSEITIFFLFFSSSHFNRTKTTEQKKDEFPTFPSIEKVNSLPSEYLTTPSRQNLNSLSNEKQMSFAEVAFVADLRFVDVSNNLNLSRPLSMEIFCVFFFLFNVFNFFQLFSHLF